MKVGLAYKTGLVKPNAFDKSVHESGSAALVTEVVVFRPSACSSGRSSLTSYAVEPSGLALHQEVSWFGFVSSSSVETYQATCPQDRIIEGSCRGRHS